MYKLEILPYDLIFYIKDLLDPISFISFLETGSYLLNPIRTSHEERQYKNKQIEYFKTRGIDVTNKTKFLTLSNKTMTTYKLTEPGDYILIGKQSRLIKFMINGNDIHLDFNKKTIEYPQLVIPRINYPINPRKSGNSEYAKTNVGIEMTGKNLSIVNGTIIGCDTTLIFGEDVHDFIIRNMDLTLYCSYPDTFYDICIITATNGLIDNCKINYKPNRFSAISIPDINKIAAKIAAKIATKRDMLGQNIKKNIQYKSNFYTEPKRNKNNSNYQKIDRRPNNRYKSWKR